MVITDSVTIKNINTNRNRMSLQPQGLALCQDSGSMVYKMWIALAWHDDTPPVCWRPMTMLWSHLTRGAAECHKDKSPSPFIRLCFILCLLIRRRMKIRMKWVGWDDSVDKDDEDQDEDDVLSNAGWHVCAPLVSEWPRLPAAERLVVARQSPASGVTLPHPPQSVSVPALARIRRSSKSSKWTGDN